mgnify:CR=1 FL=1
MNKRNNDAEPVGAAADDRAEEIGRAMHGRDTVAQNLGVTLEEVRAGYARVSMSVREQMLNGHGTAHGGYSFMLADMAFSYACNSHGQMAFAQSAHITYMTFGRLGEVLTAISEEKSDAGRSGVYDATVYGEDGRVVAEFRGVSRTVKGQVET